MENPAAVEKFSVVTDREPYTVFMLPSGTSCALPESEGAHMIKITNVLVATDFSDTSAPALIYGREFARTFGATLHVLHVVENADVGGP